MEKWVRQNCIYIKIILTHYHADHTLGTKKLDANEIVSSEKDYSMLIEPRYIHHLTYRYPFEINNEYVMIKPFPFKPTGTVESPGE